MTHDVYRHGRVHVCRRMCPTCIFRPGNKFHLDHGRRDQMVADAIEANTAIICHSTLDGPNAVCRGFFVKHKTQTLQIAERLGVVEEV